MTTGTGGGGAGGGARAFTEALGVEPVVFNVEVFGVIVVGAAVTGVVAAAGVALAVSVGVASETASVVDAVLATGVVEDAAA